MKRAHLLLVAIVSLASACATASSSRVRDLDGNPPPYMYGARFGQIIRLVERDETDVCDRILSSRM